MRDCGKKIKAKLIAWCPGLELNRYAPFGSRDFKSRASASFATRAGLKTLELPYTNLWSREDCSGKCSDSSASF